MSLSNWLLFNILLPREFSQIVPVAHFIFTAIICPSVPSECFMVSQEGRTSGSLGVGVKQPNTAKLLDLETIDSNTFYLIIIHLCVCEGVGSSKYSQK